MTQILEGKAEKDFTKWRDKTYDESKHVHHTNWSEFPFSYQSGVYLEWLESVGIKVDIFHDSNLWNCRFTYNDITTHFKLYHHRHQATRTGVSLAGTCYNQFLK